MAIPCTCLVQEGQISPEQEAGLRTDMRSFAQHAFGDVAQISWIVVPAGSGFTAAKPSTSVLVMMQSNRMLLQEERETLLRNLCDIWMEGTGRAADEVVTVVRDPQ